MRSYVIFFEAYLLSVFLVFPQSAYAMHIMEGFLPIQWSGFWIAVTLPFLVLGLRSMQKAVKENPGLKMLLGLAGAFAFVLSALKLPSVTGSSSHLTGVGLGAILFGPAAMSVLGCIVLIFQALLLAHGGLTTLGANTFSMAVVGPLISYYTFKILQKIGAPLWLSVFLAASMGDILTYVTTSLQLAMAFPAGTGGVVASFAKFAGIFMFTQIPLAICEGLLTVIVFNILVTHSKKELQELSILKEEVHS